MEVEVAIRAGAATASRQLLVRCLIVLTTSSVSIQVYKTLGHTSPIAERPQGLPVHVRRIATNRP